MKKLAAISVIALLVLVGLSALSGYFISNKTNSDSRTLSDQERALVEKGVYHIKRTSISYPEWLSRSYAPGVRETTEWGKAFAAFNSVLQQTPPPPPTTTAATTQSTTQPAPTSLTLQPGQSWNTAYKNAKPGDVIRVAAGTHPYQEIFRDPTKDGATQRVVFQGEKGTIVNGFTTGRSGGTGNTRGADHFELRDIDIRGSMRLLLANNIVAENIGDGNVTPSSTKNNFVISSSTNITVKGGEFGPWVDGINHIARCGSNPICPPGGNITLDGVVLHDFLISNPEPHSECLMIWGTQTNGVTIRNSIMRNCTDFSVLVKAPGASNIVFENSYLDIPMPGNVATTECNPNCARAGNSIRFSGLTETFSGSRVTNNVVNGGIAVDCKCVPLSGNVKGTIPNSP